MPDYGIIQDVIDRDKSTISFIYSKKEQFGAFFSELFLYTKVKNLTDKEVNLKLKCAYNSLCRIYVTNNSVRLSFKKNYLGRFKMVNNEDLIYFKANLGRKIIDVEYKSEKNKKSFKDDIINQPDLYNQLHEEKLIFLNEEPIKSLFASVKNNKLL